MVLTSMMKDLKIVEKENFSLINEVFEFVKANSQDEAYLKKKMSIVEELQFAIRTVTGDNDIKIIPFGSACSGLGMKGSDLDLSIWRDTATKKRAKKLQLLERQLRGNACGLVIDKMTTVVASVPILRMSVYNKQLGEVIGVNLSLNEYKHVYKTVLLKAYTQCDLRFVPMTLVVKKWAQAQGILDANKQSLNSLSLTLMIVAYLQDQEQPPVLPNLQKLFPKKFGTPTTRPTFAQLVREDPVFSVAKSKNTRSVGALLSGFFEFYGNIDWRWQIISVTDGFTQKNRRGPNKPWCGKKRDLCVRDPFVELQATAKHVAGEEFKAIATAFQKADDNLKKGGSLPLLCVEVNIVDSIKKN